MLLLLLLLLLLLSMLHVSRSLDLWKANFISYVCVINCIFHLSQSSASNIFVYFSNHQEPVFPLSTPFSPWSVLQWHHEEGNLFLGYVEYNWLFYAEHCLRSVLFSPIRSRTCLSVTSSGYFIFSILPQHHILKLSKYLRSKFLSVQVSEPYKAMLQT